MRLKYVVPTLILALLVSVMPAPHTGQAQDGYQDLVSDALSELGLNCAIMDVNNLCIGYDRVETVFIGNPPNEFASIAGDKAELTTIDTVHTYPLNLADATFGIAVLYVKTTSLSGALPDQTALFMALGDVEMSNDVAPNEAVLFDTIVDVTTTASADLHDAPGANALVLGTVGTGTTLQADAISPGGVWVRVLYNEQVAWISGALLASVPGDLPVLTEESRTPFQTFTFRTASTQPPSLDVPRDVIMVQSPEDVFIEFWANEQHIQMTGIMFLSTLADGRFQLIMTDGLALVYPDSANSVRVQAGSSVILGDNSWTRVQGLPVGYSEFDMLEGLPTNITTYDFRLLNILQPSTIWENVSIEVQIEGEVPYNPALITNSNFPVIPVESRAGIDLERIEWEPFEVGGATCPDWALFHSDRDDDWDIYQLLGDNTANNISNGDGSSDIMPAESIDGNYAAFATDRYFEGGWEIQVVSIDGEYDARMTFNTGDDLNPVWGPGNLIVWETSRDGNWNIYMFDVSTGEETALTEDRANDINPFWFPDGARIIYQSDSDGDWDIYELNVITGELTALTDNDIEDIAPIVSPDSNWMAWLQQDVSGVYNLWLMDLTTGDVSQLTDMGVDIGAHVFSPDSSLIAFDTRVEQDYEVLVVRLDSRVITEVTDNQASMTSPYAAEDRAPAFLCTDSFSVLFHSDIDADLNNPYTMELYRATIPADGAPAILAQRLTIEPEAYDQYTLGNAFEERESKQQRWPPHPFR